MAYTLGQAPTTVKRTGPRQLLVTKPKPLKKCCPFRRQRRDTNLSNVHERGFSKRNPCELMKLVSPADRRRLQWLPSRFTNCAIRSVATWIRSSAVAKQQRT